MALLARPGPSLHRPSLPSPAPGNCTALLASSPVLSRHVSRSLHVSRKEHSPAAATAGLGRASLGRGKPGTCRALFGLGLPELLVIGGVAVVLFGPKQLPEIGKSLGKTVKGFQEAAQEFQTELKEAAKADSEEASTADSAGVQTAPQAKESVKGEVKK